MRMMIWVCLISCAMFFSCATAQPAHAMLYPSTLLAWQTTPLPPPAPSGASDETVLAHLDRPFTVSVRQWAAVSDTPEQFSLQLSALLSDSRCPAQVNCVVAGQVEFRLLLRTNNVVSPRLFQIGSYPIHDQNKLRYAGYEIELQEVEPPAPPPGQRLNVSDYRVTLVVRRDTTVDPTPSATSAQTATPTPQSQPHDSETLRLGQPFTMRVGETTSLDDIDFQLTLRSISDDSGCLTATDCSVMTADGTLILQQGTQREILTFMASITPEQSFDYDFAGYVVRLLHLEVGRDGKAVATFVVARPMAAAAIPDPEWITTCPHFSSFDAAAILQEEVEPRAIANLVFGPIAPDAETVTGFCGYLATANDQTAATDPTTAHIVSDVNAARGVVATIVDGDDSAQLLQLAQLLSADTNGTPAARYQLQAMLMAGDYEGVIGTLRDLAAENEAASSSAMIDVGDEGMWFWQPVADGYFAMLVAREEERFAVVVALLNRDADEEFVRDHMIVAARYLE